MADKAGRNMSVIYTFLDQRLGNVEFRLKPSLDSPGKINTVKTTIKKVHKVCVREDTRELLSDLQQTLKELGINGPQLVLFLSVCSSTCPLKRNCAKK